MAEDDRRVQTTSSDSKRMTTEQLKLIGAAAVGLILLVFFLSNMQEVSIKFLWMDWEIDMIWALLLSALLGGLAVFLGMWFIGRRRTNRER